MKAEIFVVAFCFLLAGAFFTYAKHSGFGNNHESTIVINNENFHEEIKYSGKIDFSDDETAIKSISPGGYMDFTRNGEQLLVKSDKQGVISYQLTEGEDTKVEMDSKGKQFLAVAVKEMIALGIDANERMDRIYSKGGNRALMNELANLKNDDVKRMYLERILKSDSLSSNDLAEMSKKITQSLGSDQDKEQVLKAFKAEMLKDSTAAQAYLQAVESFGDDNAKASALKTLLKAPISAGLFPQFIDVSNGIRDDNQKEEVFREIIRKVQLDQKQADLMILAIGHLSDENQKRELISQLIRIDGFAANNFDKLLQQISQFRDESQMENLYMKLMGERDLSETQWVDLIAQISTVSNDNEKSNLLVRLAQKMPKSDQVKMAYLKAAKTIMDDSEYGKTLRAIE
jgi:hypothetical protein